MKTAIDEATLAQLREVREDDLCRGDLYDLEVVSVGADRYVVATDAAALLAVRGELTPGDDDVGGNGVPVMRAVILAEFLAAAQKAPPAAPIAADLYDLATPDEICSLCVDTRKRVCTECDGGTRLTYCPVCTTGHNACKRCDGDGWDWCVCDSRGRGVKPGAASAASVYGVRLSRYQLRRAARFVGPAAEVATVPINGADALVLRTVDGARLVVVMPLRGQDVAFSYPLVTP